MQPTAHQAVGAQRLSCSFEIEAVMGKTSVEVQDPTVDDIVHIIQSSGRPAFAYGGLS